MSSVPLLTKHYTDGSHKINLGVSITWVLSNNFIQFFTFFEELGCYILLRTSGLDKFFQIRAY